MNYSTQYRRFRRTDVTISAKSLSFHVPLHLNWKTKSPNYVFRIRKTNPLKEVFSEIHYVLFIEPTSNPEKTKGVAESTELQS